MSGAGMAAPKPAPSLADVINGAAATLRAAGVDTPAHDAKLLMAEAAGCDLHEVDLALLMGESAGFVDGDDNASAASDPDAGCRCRWAAALPTLRMMVARRAAREPLQLIVGHAPFRWLDLKVGPGVFIPRAETETVVQAALDWLAAQGLGQPRVADLCAGSGAIGLSVVTEVPGSEVWAVELSDRALTWTERNRREVLGEGTVAAGRYHLVSGDATDPAVLRQLDGSLDAVVSNPPYVPRAAIPGQPEVRDYDPELALYGGSDDGLALPERIIGRAAALLRPGGLLVMEHDVSQDAALCDYALDHGFATASTGLDLAGRPRFLTATKA